MKRKPFYTYNIHIKLIQLKKKKKWLATTMETKQYEVSDWIFCNLSSKASEGVFIQTILERK